jgi:hypothetical protein
VTVALQTAPWIGVPFDVTDGHRERGFGRTFNQNQDGEMLDGLKLSIE